MNKNKVLSLTMFITAILFFIVYFLKRDTVFLILGFAWICIGFSSYEKNNIFGK